MMRSAAVDTTDIVILPFLRNDWDGDQAIVLM
jgi:hypothetical protein